MQDSRKFPFKITYFIGQGPVEIALPAAIISNKLTTYNVDLGARIDYNFALLTTSNVTGPTLASLANVKIIGNVLIIN